MGIRILVLALVAALALSAVPVQAKKMAMKKGEQMEISEVYAKGAEMVANHQWNAGIAAMTQVIDNPQATKDLMANAYADRGMCYANKKMYDDALMDFNKALEIKPDMQNALYERARVEAMVGKHAEAAMDLDKVISMEGSSPSLASAAYYYNRGVSLMNMVPPNPEKAKSDFAMAKKLNPKLKIPVKYKNL